MPPQEAYAEAAADLAAEAAGKKSKRQRKGGAAAAGGEAGDEEDAFFASLASQDRLPKFVELLKFRVGAWQTSCSFKTVVVLEMFEVDVVCSLHPALRHRLLLWRLTGKIHPRAACPLP